MRDMANYCISLPQSKIKDFCQPCRARAPFVRFADIFPAIGEICPHQREPRAQGIRCRVQEVFTIRFYFV